MSYILSSSLGRAVMPVNLSPLTFSSSHHLRLFVNLIHHQHAPADDSGTENYGQNNSHNVYYAIYENLKMMTTQSSASSFFHESIKGRLNITFSYLAAFSLGIWNSPNKSVYI